MVMQGNRLLLTSTSVSGDPLLAGAAGATRRGDLGNSGLSTWLVFSDNTMLGVLLTRARSATMSHISSQKMSV